MILAPGKFIISTVVACAGPPDVVFGAEQWFEDYVSFVSAE
jgi:hypothetical protein